MFVKCVHTFPVAFLVLVFCEKCIWMFNAVNRNSSLPLKGRLLSTLVVSFQAFKSVYQHSAECKYKPIKGPWSSEAL